MSLAYRIPVVGAKTQAVVSADRPLCAYVAALASREPLLGSWSKLTREQQELSFAAEFRRREVPYHRATSWAHCVRHAGDRGTYAGADEIAGLWLSPYQRRAVEQMTPAGGVMALGCGLGKTLAALAALCHARARGYIKDDRVWVACPLNAVPTWRRHLSFLRARFKDVQVISIDSLHKVFPENIGGAIIFDEVHLLGDMTARRTENAHRVRAMFDYGLCLTGTLLHGGIEKTLSIMDLAVPGMALFANRWEAGEFFSCLVKKRLGSRTVTALEKPTGINKQRFMEWISRCTISLSRTSEEVRASVQIPDQTLGEALVGEPWRALEVEAAEIIRERVEDGEPIPHAQEVAHLLCRQGLDQKLEWLFDAMDGDDAPVVIFAEYHETLDATEDALKRQGITYVRVDGAVTGQARSDAQAAFQSGAVRVFLGQMDAACTAMDLFRAQVSVALDHTWKAANYNQMLARTCRRGQQQKTYHFDLMANRLQRHVVTRLRNSEDFDASLVEYQQLKSTIDSAKALATVSGVGPVEPTPQTQPAVHGSTPES
jgi:hypothetical protein